MVVLLVADTCFMSLRILWDVIKRGEAKTFDWGKLEGIEKGLYTYSGMCGSGRGKSDTCFGHSHSRQFGLFCKSSARNSLLVEIIQACNSCEAEEAKKIAKIIRDSCVTKPTKNKAPPQE